MSCQYRWKKLRLYLLTYASLRFHSDLLSDYTPRELPVSFEYYN